MNFPKFLPFLHVLIKIAANLIITRFLICPAICRTWLNNSSDRPSDQSKHSKPGIRSAICQMWEIECNGYKRGGISGMWAQVIPK